MMANNPDSDFNLKCQIIEEVRQRPILFNKGHPMYFVRNAKNDEFTNIGLALGITGAEVEKKWKDLLDTFRRKVKSGAGGDNASEKASQWRFYQRMSFIKPYIGHKGTATNCPAPNIPRGLEAEDTDGDNGANENADAPDDGQQAWQQQTVAPVNAAQPGPSGDDAPNAMTYCSSRKRSNKRQQEREDFQQQLLETLKSDGKDEEQDGTDLAMMAMVKKMKRNLSADQQEDLIDELQQVVSRFCREVKRGQNRPLPSAAGGSAQAQQMVAQNDAMGLQPYNAVGQVADVNGAGLLSLQTVDFANM